MTQVIAALTPEYAIMATDRRLTWITGPCAGKTKDDDTCKLVSLCGIGSFAYTGVANLEGKPTHEWIAIRLAEKKCRNPAAAAEILRDAATRAVPRGYQHSFVYAGFRFEDGWMFPQLIFVTNLRLDSAGVPRPVTDFHIRSRILRREDRKVVLLGVGHPFLAKREVALRRHLRKLVHHGVGPSVAQRALIDEIIYTSKNSTTNLVGGKVLSFCVPSFAAQRAYSGGFAPTIAALAGQRFASFAYFESGYSELLQYGPTVACGDSAFSVETENDPSRDYQSSTIKLIYVPNAKI